MQRYATLLDTQRYSTLLATLLYTLLATMHRYRYTVYVFTGAPEGCQHGTHTQVGRPTHEAPTREYTTVYDLCHTPLAPGARLSGCGVS